MEGEMQKLIVDLNNDQDLEFDIREDMAILLEGKELIFQTHIGFYCLNPSKSYCHKDVELILIAVEGKE